jgi:hypothetical protein
MTDDWISNEGASQRVIGLLRQAGVPHELRIAAICREFCSLYPRTSHPHASTQKLVYSPDPGGEFREIDQFLQLYDEFQVDELTGIQLMLDVPIECKHRSNVAYFAFPVPGLPSRSAFPIVSHLAGSDYFRDLISTYQQVESLPPADLTLVEIDAGRTPKAVYKENVIYNAAALYDFVLFELRDGATPRTRGDAIIARLFQDFQEYLARNHYAWWSVLRQWMAANVRPKAPEFNRRYFDGHRLYHSVTAHFPIVCVSGDLFRVSCDDHGDITGFEKTFSCISGIRKHGWPGAARFALLKRTAEVPVVVTNSSGLCSVLEVAAKWYRAIHDALRRANPQAIEAWPIEAAFFQHAAQHFSNSEPDGGYRSDLDITKWL